MKIREGVRGIFTVGTITGHERRGKTGRDTGVYISKVQTLIVWQITEGKEARA